MNPDDMDRTRLRTALDALEAATAEPIVPGEAEEWFRNAKAIGTEIAGAWAPYRGRMKDTLVEIQENDLSLRPRVLELRENGRRIERRWGELRARLREASERAERDGLQSDPADLEMVAQMQVGLREWAVEARELDSAATTWLIESVYRDRGVAD